MASSEKTKNLIDTFLAIFILIICAFVLYGSKSIRDLPYEPLGASFFPIVISLVLGVLGLLLLIKSVIKIFNYKQLIIEENETKDLTLQYFIQRPSLAFATIFCTLAYIFLLSSKLIGFRLGTIVFVTVVGTIISRFNLQKSIASGFLGLALGIGLYYIFTKIFVIDLP